MIVTFFKPVIEITEFDRLRSTKNKDKYKNSGIIFKTKICHACGMENVKTLKHHDLLNPYCPWTIYRSKPLISVDINESTIIHLFCNIHLGSNKMIEDTFILFDCNHIVCIPCAMSLIPFRCPYCLFLPSREHNARSYVVKFHCC
jgi:hypothetical protein